MTNNSKIEWTEKTWNPSTGCTKVSSGCKNCYAEAVALKLQKEGSPKYKDGFKVTLHPYALRLPFSWLSSTVFVNSMSDLFHQDIPLEFIQKVFEVMNKCPQHTFQVLTKRPLRLLEFNDKLNWTKNIWMGVSVEDKVVIDRIDLLRRCDAKTKFLSLEPLIGPLPNLNLDGIDWVIVGGESGPKARPMKAEWVQDILKQCEAAKVPFFFKQWGGVNKYKTGRQLNGRTYDDMPLTEIRVAQSANQV